MKNELVESFVTGFKDCFRLAAYLFVAVVSVIGAFSNHSLGEKHVDSKQDGRASQSS